jgi:hypothetical protein
MSINGKTFVPEGSADNIIEFPEKRIKRWFPEAEPEIIKEAKKLATQNFANDITDNIIKRIIKEYQMAGVNTQKDVGQFEKDLSFTVEAVRSMTYRLLGIKHHLQDFIDSNVKLKDMEDVDIENENAEIIVGFTPDFEIDDEPEPA